MNTRALAPLSAALVMLTTLAGCGQTGPLYMSDNQAARTQYDPANDYQLPAAEPKSAQPAPQTTATSASTTPAPIRSQSEHTERTPAPTADAPAARKGAVPTTPAPTVAPAPQTRPQVQPLRIHPEAITPAVTPAPTVAPAPTASPAAASPAKKWSNIEWTPYRAGVDQ